MRVIPSIRPLESRRVNGASNLAPIRARPAAAPRSPGSYFEPLIFFTQAQSFPQLHFPPLSHPQFISPHALHFMSSSYRHTTPVAPSDAIPVPHALPSLQYTARTSNVKQAMTYVYSVFSHVLWPMYQPFAVGLLEAVRWRKRTLYAFEAAGVSVGLYLLYSLVTRPMVAEVVGKHIAYASPHFYLLPVMVLYVAATCVSCFFSSHGFVTLFGVLALLSFITAYIVHVEALVSIWCFFAAILSLLIYVHLRFRGLGGFPTEGLSESGGAAHRAS